MDRMAIFLDEKRVYSNAQQVICKKGLLQVWQE
jgi:hypothetical protein